MSAPDAPLRPIVVKVGGALLDVAPAAAAVWRALAGLSRRGVPLVLVHGGGSSVDRLLARLGHTTVKHAGLRVTPEDQIADVVGALAGTVNHAIAAAMVAAGARAIGTSIAAAGLTRAQPHPDAALGRVGVVAGGDGTVLHDLLGAGFVPVLSSIGADAEGRALNINADDAAAAVALHSSARLLALLTDVPCVLDAQRRPIASLDSAAAEGLIAQGVIGGGMIPKVRSALAAAAGAGCPALITTWRDARALESLDARRPEGTLLEPPREPVPERSGR